jgi:hypothetical protein
MITNFKQYLLTKGVNKGYCLILYFSASFLTGLMQKHANDAEKAYLYLLMKGVNENRI